MLESDKCRNRSCKRALACDKFLHYATEAILQDPNSGFLGDDERDDCFQLRRALTEVQPSDMKRYKRTRGKSFYTRGFTGGFR